MKIDTVAHNDYNANKKANDAANKGNKARGKSEKAENTQGNKGNKEIKDKYVPGNKQEENLSYKKPLSKADQKTIDKLKADSEQVYQKLRDLVEKLLAKQGRTFQDLVEIDNIEYLEDIEIDEATRAEAAEMIAEGGKFSAEAVSDSIVDFAIAISGGDKEKLDLLRGAIDEGFKAAEELFGGSLPEISYQTYDMIMEKLDNWEQGIEEGV